MKRFDEHWSGAAFDEMREFPDGKWVLFEDAQKVVHDLEEAMTILQTATGAFEALEITGSSQYLPGFIREKERLQAFLDRVRPPRFARMVR